MSSDFTLDASYLGLVYRNEILEVAKTATIYSDEPAKVSRVTETLVGVSNAVIGSIKEALNKDFNNANFKFSYKKYQANYCKFEELLRKIFHDVFNITCEKSSLAASQSLGLYTCSEDLSAELFLSWKYQQGQELRTLFGLKEQECQASGQRKCLNEFRKDKRFCDYTLLVKTTEFPVHKVVLAEYSEYFETFFWLNLKKQNRILRSNSVKRISPQRSLKCFYSTSTRGQ